MKEKDSACLDLSYLWITAFGNVSWAIYGHVFKDIYIYVPYLFGSLFSTWSLVIFFYYRKPWRPTYDITHDKKTI